MWRLNPAVLIVRPNENVPTMLGVQIIAYCFKRIVGFHI